jgi:hypothetical protein
VSHDHLRDPRFNWSQKRLLIEILEKLNKVMPQIDDLNNAIAAVSGSEDSILALLTQEDADVATIETDLATVKAALAAAQAGTPTDLTAALAALGNVSTKMATIQKQAKAADDSLNAAVAATPPAAPPAGG